MKQDTNCFIKNLGKYLIQEHKALHLSFIFTYKIGSSNAKRKTLHVYHGQKFKGEYSSVKSKWTKVGNLTDLIKPCLCTFCAVCPLTDVSY